MNKSIWAVCMIVSIFLATVVNADELTQIIQKDLAALGYEPGNTRGEMTTETAVAISKFQAENNLDVTGVATPQLAGIIKARLKSNNGAGAQASAPGVAATASAAAPRAAAANDPAALQAAQQACLQKKVADAQAAKKKKRGFGSLMRAVGRTAARFGGDELAQEVSRRSSDIYDVNATAEDLESAAKDLGLTTDDLEDCRNPAM